MKRIFLLPVLILLTSALLAQSVGIGTQTPHTSTLLDVSSTNKGLLAPVMTKARLDAIANPANGLLITCSDCSAAGLHQYINGVRETLPQLAFEQCLSLLSTGMSRKGMWFR
jgi:hypothetical protein